MEDQLQPRLCQIRKYFLAGINLYEVIEEVNHKITEEHIAAEALVAGGYGHLDSDSCDDQTLMCREADAKDEQCPIKKAILVRRVEPSQNADQHNEEPWHAGNRDTIDGHRFPPHEAVQTHEQPSDATRYHADGALPLAGHILEFLDALHQHAAASGHDQAYQAASQ